MSDLSIATQRAMMAFRAIERRTLGETQCCEGDTRQQLPILHYGKQCDARIETANDLLWILVDLGMEEQLSISTEL